MSREEKKSFHVVYERRPAKFFYKIFKVFSQNFEKFLKSFTKFSKVWKFFEVFKKFFTLFFYESATRPGEAFKGHDAFRFKIALKL